MKHELYKQLHEQYAVNNNANLSTVMTLIVALIAVIGFYGHIFIHSSNSFACNAEQTRIEVTAKSPNSSPEEKNIHSISNDANVKGEAKNGSFYDATSETYFLEALLFAYGASILVLGILFCICTYQGISQRKEQFIIYAIRDQNDANNLLPDGYDPYDKKCLQIIQGLFGELVKIFWGVALILFILTLWKICTKNCIVLTIFIGYSVIILIYCFWYFLKQCASYMDRQLEYVEQKYKIDEQKAKKIKCIKNEKYNLCKVCEGTKFVQDLEKKDTPKS